MTHAERWAKIQADCRRAQTQAINYSAPDKGIKFTEPINSAGRKRTRIPRYELTGIVRGTVAIYC